MPGGRLAGAVADGLLISSDRATSPAPPGSALVEVDRGEVVPGGRLAGAVADGLLDLKRPRELLPRRRVGALVEVDRGELVPGGRLAGAVADGLLDLKRPRELLPRRRVGALLEVDRGELVPGGRLAGAVADGLLDLKRPRELLPRRRVGALVEVDRGELVPGGRLAGAVVRERFASPLEKAPGRLPLSQGVFHARKRSQTLRVVIVVRDLVQERTRREPLGASLQKPAQPHGRPAEGGNIPASPGVDAARGELNVDWHTELGLTIRFEAQPPEGGEPAVDFAGVLLREALRVGEPGAKEAGRVVQRRPTGLVEPLEQAKGDAGVQARLQPPAPASTILATASTGKGSSLTARRRAASRASGERAS